MHFKPIRGVSQNPKPTFLTVELAVCYVLHVLLETDAHRTELRQRVESDYPGYKLSKTIFYRAMRVLERKQLIVKYWDRNRRGLPDQTLKVHPYRLAKAEELARRWQAHVSQRQPSLDTAIASLSSNSLYEYENVLHPIF